MGVGKQYISCISYAASFVGFAACLKPFQVFVENQHKPDSADTEIYSAKDSHSAQEAVSVLKY